MVMMWMCDMVVMWMGDMMMWMGAIDVQKGWVIKMLIWMYVCVHVDRWRRKWVGILARLLCFRV